MNDPSRPWLNQIMYVKGVKIPSQGYVLCRFKTIPRAAFDVQKSYYQWGDISTYNDAPRVGLVYRSGGVRVGCHGNPAFDNFLVLVPLDVWERYMQQGQENEFGVISP